MKSHLLLDRRTFLKQIGLIGATAPFFTRNLISAPPSEMVRHASFGAAGQAWSDINDFTASSNFSLVAVADPDLSRTVELRKKFPKAKVYQDWRRLFDAEKDQIDSVNVSTPDHSHAPIAVTALNLGKHVYGQKPLTHEIYETRRVTLLAREKKGRHPDGNPDSFRAGIQTLCKTDSGRRDWQNQGGPFLEQ